MTNGDHVTKLLEQGRDRDAAEAGEVLSQLDTLGAALAGVVGNIRPDQLDNPTPCADFTVRGVLEHMVVGATAFTAAFRGEPAPTDTTPPKDVLGAFGPTLGALVESMAAPGALDRTVAAPFGEVPGITFARFVVLDGLVHGWDMATATGQPYDPPDALVADADAFARGAVDPRVDGDTFADPTEAPAGATPIERLAAYTGRTVTGGTR
jgi:uncharacterized protein (TIGR03086 family)